MEESVLVKSEVRTQGRWRKAEPANGDGTAFNERCVFAFFGGYSGDSLCTT
jgi:hypothetical protein